MRRIYVLFFLSGIAGLIYQVVWSRLLNEIFGVTVYAVTTVLATFLGGLEPLGGFILGRVADRQAKFPWPSMAGSSGQRPRGTGRHVDRARLRAAPHPGRRRASLPTASP